MMRRNTSNAFVATLVLAIFIIAPLMAKAESRVKLSISPSDGIVHPGDIVNFNVDVVGISSPRGVLISGDLDRVFGNSQPSLKTAPPYRFSGTVTVMPRYGSINMTAVVFDSYGVQIESDPITLEVRPTVSFSDIRIESDVIDLRYVGEQASPSIRLKTGDKWIFGGKINAIECASLNTSIAQVLPGCKFVAAGIGNGSAKIRIEGLERTISIVVRGSIKGDYNGDGMVDQSDLDRLQSDLGTKIVVPNDARDINGDGKIDALDLRVLTTLCTRPRCATQ